MFFGKVRRASKKNNAVKLQNSVDVSTPRRALGLRRSKRRVPTFCALPSRRYCQTKDNACTERRETKTAQSKTTFRLNCKFLLEQENCKTQQKLKLVHNGRVLRGGGKGNRALYA